MPDIPDPRFEGGVWCQTVLEQLDDYLTGVLSDPHRVAIDAHLAACSQCAQFGGTYAGVVTALQRELGRAPKLADDTAERLNQRLGELLDAQHLR